MSDGGLALVPVIPTTWTLNVQVDINLAKIDASISMRILFFLASAI